MNLTRIILNPVAGRGNGARCLPAIHAALAHYQIHYDLIQTTGPGDATHLAQQAIQDGVEVIVAAGGDGTLNEVVNGFMACKQAGEKLPALGVLCVGRGNDFAGSVGIPADIDSACRLLKEAPRRPIDIGRVTGGIYPQGRYFINVVGIGFDAVGTIEVSKLPRWGGTLSFVIAIFKTIFLYNKAPLAEICYDGTRLTQRSLLISMMNGRRLGGGFFLAPTAQQDDGLIDLCIAEQMTSLQIIRLLPHFTKGTHVTQPKIKMAQARSITITALDGPLPTQTDGEIISTDSRRIEVEILPRQIEGDLQMSLAQRLLVALFRGVTDPIFSVHAEALARVPMTGPLIIVMNHINIFEIPIIYARLQPRPVHGLVLADRWKNPILGWGLDACGSIPLERGSSNVTSFKRALDVLKAGEMVLIMPEGTRSGDGRLQPAFPGVVLLALKSKAPLLPVVSYGGECYRENIRRFRRTDFYLAVGQSFALAETSERSSRHELVNQIMFRIAALLPPKYRGIYANQSPGERQMSG